MPIAGARRQGLDRYDSIERAHGHATEIPGSPCLIREVRFVSHPWRLAGQSTLTFGPGSQTDLALGQRCLGYNRIGNSGGPPTPSLDRSSGLALRLPGSGGV